jgi:hypothetical protein
MKKQINHQSKTVKTGNFITTFKKWNKYTIFLIFLMLSNKTFKAQNTDCKYSVNGIDKFTKKMVMQTKWKRLTAAIALDGKRLEVCGKKVDSEVVLLFDFSVTHSVTLKGGVTNDDIANQKRWIPKDFELIVLLEDESTVTLKTNEDFQSRTTYSVGSKTFNNINYNFNNTMEIKYPLTSEQLSILSSKGATSIRLYFQTSEGKKESFDCEFGKKRLDTLKEVVDCVKN